MLLLMQQHQNPDTADIKDDDHHHNSVQSCKLNSGPATSMLGPREGKFGPEELPCLQDPIPVSPT